MGSTMDWFRFVVKGLSCPVFVVVQPHLARLRRLLFHSSVPCELYKYVHLMLLCDRVAILNL